MLPLRSSRDTLATHNETLLNYRLIMHDISICSGINRTLLNVQYLQLPIIRLSGYLLTQSMQVLLNWDIHNMTFRAVQCDSKRVNVLSLIEFHLTYEPCVFMPFPYTFRLLLKTMGRLDGKVIVLSAAAQGIGKASAIVTIHFPSISKISHPPYSCMSLLHFAGA